MNIVKTMSALAKKEIQNGGRWCEVTLKRTGEVVRIERLGYRTTEWPEFEPHKVSVNGMELFGTEFRNLGEVAVWMCERKLTLETIERDLRWVGELDDDYGKHRFVGSYAEVQKWLDADPEHFSDCDLCAKQPDHLKDFCEKWDKYIDEHGFITLKDFYAVYAKEAQA